MKYHMFSGYDIVNVFKFLAEQTEEYDTLDISEAQYFIYLP